jgi:hypothetical protein
MTELQIARLSDSDRKCNSKRYDRRRFNGNRRFGVLMAARRRSQAVESESVAKAREREQVAADEQAERIIQQMLEISRIRGGAPTY